MTPGNGAAPSSQQGQHRVAEVLVQTHILTHLIEGFVIQEGARPFPVERPSFSVDSLRRHSGDGDMDDLSATVLQEPTLTCELCGKVDFASIFKRSKRFCSTACAKRYNVGCTRRVGLFPNRSSLENERKRRILSGNVKNFLLEDQKTSAAPLSSGASRLLTLTRSSQRLGVSAYQRPEEPLRTGPQTPGAPQTTGAPQTPGPPAAELPFSFLPSNPGRWNIDDVYGFISSLPGCLEIAEEFRSQEIDGQALLLLKEDHLMATMNIKLGPALKIFAQINSLKDS